LPSQIRPRFAAGLISLLALGPAPRYFTAVAAQASARATLVVTAVVGSPARSIGLSRHPAQAAWARRSALRPDEFPAEPPGGWVRAGARHLRFRELTGPLPSVRARLVEIADLGA
jgi:hypothetical protein